MRNIINRCSSRMWLALALLVSLVIASQMLPSTLAVDKGPLAAAPARVYPFVTRLHGAPRPDDPFVTNLARKDGANISPFAVGNFTVNSLADPGDGTCDLTECTLREAIVAANANAGPDVIGFSVTGTINLTGALPPITDAVAINGPGAAQLTVPGTPAEITASSP